jgi:hypothetical protein
MKRMQKNSNRLLAAAAGLLICAAVGIIYFQFFRGPLEVHLPAPGESLGECPGPEYSFTMPDQFMRGLIEQGEWVTVKMNYYGCNKIERDDVVLFRFSNFADPVIRIVKGLPNDEFKVAFDKAHAKWFLTIANEPVRDVNNEIHYFGNAKKPLLAQYEENLHGKLSSDMLLILCSQPPCVSDSTQFGMVALKDVMGRIVKGDHGRKVNFKSDPLPPLSTPAPEEGSEGSAGAKE